MEGKVLSNDACSYIASASYMALHLQTARLHVRAL